MNLEKVVARFNQLSTAAARLDGILPILVRMVFFAVLAVYFWKSALTKLGGGVWGFLTPSSGAYVQIFPKAMEQVGYDTSQLGLWHWFVVLAGTWAEFILPLMIIIGFLTRLSALGMIGFIIVQSLTDLFGHGLISSFDVVGTWFDRTPDAVIMDQRLLWIFLLFVLVVKGAGKLSVDHIFLQGRYTR